MLRFGSTTSRPNSRLPSKLGWRIWIILGLIGIVIGAMQSLEQPATIAQLDAMFQPESKGAKPQASYSEISIGKSLVAVEAQTGGSAQAASGKSKLAVDLSQVKDNTYFRPQENTAWFAILADLRNQTSAQIRSETVGNVTYAQLLAQPNVYRGQIVTVQGRVLREESLDAPENDIGITSYHRLVIRPRGGGVWPIIIYCLDLPESFPRGENLDVEIAVHGVFFKNWSYAWDDGLGLAPVLLAKTVHSQPISFNEPSVNDSSSAFPQPRRETSEPVMGSFREVLELIGLEPTKLKAFSTGQGLTNVDWQILTQLMVRLQRYSATELSHWTLPADDMSSKSIGDLFNISGTALEFEQITVPAEFINLLGMSRIYRCKIRITNMQSVTVFTSEIPNRWQEGTLLDEPVRCRAVLLQVVGENLVMVTNHLSWFPKAGAISGQLLLAQYGMDAALWDDVKQRGKFVSPTTSREAEAFFACLAALDAIPRAQLTDLVSQQLARQAKSEPANNEGESNKIAATVAAQAQRGFSSVVPMFLAPEEQAGELVRLEGIARRAVRIVEEAKSDDGIPGARRDYYELELFTPDSQNLPVICCVSQLPAGFPLGDKIREQIRLEGVFFKSWRYRSRNLVEESGETTRQQQRYTPIVLARSITWIPQASAGPGWWGLVAGIGFLILLAIAWISFVFHWRTDRRPKETDEQIDLPNL